MKQRKSFINKPFVQQSHPLKNQIIQIQNLFKSTKLQKRVNPIFPTLNDSSSTKFKKKKKRISLESGGNQVTHKAIEKSVVEFRFVGLAFAQSRWRIASSLAVCGEDCLQKDAQEKRCDYVTKTRDELERMSTRNHRPCPNSGRNLAASKVFESTFESFTLLPFKGWALSQAGFRLSASGLIKLLARR